MNSEKTELMTVGGGCFWCVEAIFNQVKGVKKVVSGYSGGNSTGKPTYREVCSVLTGHAEVVQIHYNANTIYYIKLLLIFMTSHNPPTLNRHDEDVRTQYLIVIYLQNDTQKLQAEEVLKELSPYFEKPIVTEISKLGMFYVAEGYHQDY